MNTALFMNVEANWICLSVTAIKEMFSSRGPIDLDSLCMAPRKGGKAPVGSVLLRVVSSA